MQERFNKRYFSRNNFLICWFKKIPPIFKIINTKYTLTNYYFVIINAERVFPRRKVLVFEQKRTV